ncbi:hypothetical protein JCM10450v2_006401 [Rhodotorula kratochvilovae]
MPVAPLPDELVDLIPDHLDAILEEPKRREIGLRVSLVCKKWRPLGHHLAWRTLMVRTRDDDAFLEDLLAHPATVKEIRKLHFQPRDPRTEDGASAPGTQLATSATNILSLRLIEACSPQVVVLHAPMCVPQFSADVLKRMSCAALAPALRRLTWASAITDEFDPTDFATSLKRFKSLQRLSLHFIWAAEHPLTITAEPDACRIPLKTLSLQLIALAQSVPGAGHSVVDLLHTLLDPHVLKSIILPEYWPELLPTEWLAKFTHLRELVVITPSIVHLVDSFARIVALLPGLQQLEDLLVMPDIETYKEDKPIAPSPVSLDTLLRSLPPTLKAACIGGFILELADDTPIAYYDVAIASQLPAGVLIWLQTARNGEGEPVKARLVFASSPDACAKWCVSARRRPDDNGETPASASPSSVA